VTLARNQERNSSLPPPFEGLFAFHFMLLRRIQLRFVEGSPESSHDPSFFYPGAWFLHLSATPLSLTPPSRPPSGQLHPFFLIECPVLVSLRRFLQTLQKVAPIPHNCFRTSKRVILPPPSSLALSSYPPQGSRKPLFPCRQVAPLPPVSFGWIQILSARDRFKLPLPLN